MTELAQKPGQQAHREADDGVPATPDDPGEFAGLALDRVRPSLAQRLATGNVGANLAGSQTRQPNLARGQRRGPPSIGGHQAESAVNKVISV